jgi:hypothetical protein
MADNNNVAAGGDGGEGIPQPPEDDLTYVDTIIEEVTSSRPNERKFSVKFDNFKELPSEKGHLVESTKLSCFGHEWRLDIYPGGHEEASDGMVTLSLHRISKGKGLKIQFSFEIGKQDINIIRQITNDNEFYEGNSWGVWNFISRDELLDDYLEEGALIVYVSMQLAEFTPKNPTSDLIMKLFRDEKSADVVFEVSEKQKPEGKSKSRKRAKVASANFYAHRFILQQHSPELASLCATSEGMTPVLINDVKPEVFRHLLYYLYGGEISEEEFKVHSKDLINAADKYGVTNLKLEAEVWYVHHTEITIDNVIDNLLYADAMSCALLKETVMDFIVKNKKEVMQRVSFQDVPGNMYKDLLAAVARCENEKKEDSDSDDSDSDDDDEDENEDSEDFDTMRIGELRKKVQEKGLEIDGSRDALIAALKEHS